MTNCWAILEILPTQNAKAISRARRSLIRKWHPDTVEDPQRKREYTVRCATINAAHDEAVKIAETRERVLHRGFPPRARRTAAFSTSGLRFSTPVAAWLAVVYLLTFRYSFVATVFAFLFLAGGLIASITGLIVYRVAVRPLLSHVERLNQPVLPWAVLELANVLVLSFWFPNSEPLFQAGLVLGIPLWRLWRWMKQSIGRERSPIW